MSIIKNPNNEVSIQPCKPSHPNDVSICKGPAPKSKFEEGMDRLLGILLSGFTNANHDVKLRVTGHKDANGFGRSETSIWPDPRTQVRLLQNKTESRTDMRSIVSRTLEDGTTLGVTTASWHDAKGKLKEVWTRYTKGSTLGEERTDAKNTLAKFLNIKDMDTTKDVKIQDEARIIHNEKGERIRTEYTKTINYVDKNGQSHEQKITVVVDANDKQQKFEMTLDGKKQPVPANSELIANYVQHDVSKSYYDNKEDFAEMADLGDYGAYDVISENKTKPKNEGEMLSTLAKILRQIVELFSKNGPQSFEQVFNLLNMVNNLAAQAEQGGDISTQIASLEKQLAGR